MARSAASKLFSSPPLRAHHLSFSRPKTSSSMPRPPPGKNTNPKPRRGDREESAAPSSSSCSSLFREIAGIVAADDPALQAQRIGEVGSGNSSSAECAQGARQIAPESGAWDSARRPAHVTEDSCSDASSDAFLAMSDTENANVSVSGSSGPPCATDDVVGRGIPTMFGTDVARATVSGSSDHADQDNVSDYVGVRAACRLAKDSDIGATDLEDVSPVVQRVAEVLQARVPGLSVEQRLNALGFTYTPKVVSMVLKTCFKVKHLGFRFFNWVRQCPGFRHTTETYNTMLYITGEARNFELVERLVAEMDTELCQKDIETWTILIASYGKARQIGRMLSTFEDMRKSGCAPNSTLYRAVLRSLCSAAEPELAFEFYRDMASSGMEVSSDVYQLLLYCLAKSGNVEAVHSVRDEMIKSLRFAEGEAYIQTLRSFSAAGKLKETLDVLEEMKEKSIVNSVALLILLKGFCRAGRMDEALEIMKYIKNTSSVSCRAYGFLIDGYLRKGDLVKAAELLREMRESGIVPLASSYTQLMHHLFASYQYNEACELFEEMQENGVEPDIVKTATMIAGHLRHGQVSRARNVFRSIGGQGQMRMLKVYTVFIQELCNASRPLEAFELLKGMSESNMKPPDRTFSRVISALRENCYWEEVGSVHKLRELFIFENPERELQPGPSKKVSNVVGKPSSDSGPEENELTSTSAGLLSEKDCEISTCSLSQDNDHIEQAKEYCEEDVEEVFSILSSSNDWSSMEEALERRSLHFTPEMVDAILQRCRRNNRAALQFFHWVGRRSYYTPTTMTYNTAMKLAGNAKDFKHMRYLYHEMRRVGCPPTADSWTVMISQYGQASLTEMALEAFHQMKSDGVQPNASTYNELILYLCRRKGQKVDAAIQIFQEMRRAGYMLRNERASAYLSALCECGKTAAARRSVVQMCKGGFPAQVGYSMLIRSMCRAGRIGEALKLLNGIEKLGCSMDQYIYGSIIHALLRGDRFDDALEKLSEMKNAGIPQSTHMYTSFIVHFFQKKEIAKAMDMLKEMAENGCRPTVVTYSALIRGYMNMGMVSEAMDVFYGMKLKGPPPDFETYTMFMSCLCNAGRSEDGLLMIRDMSESGMIPSAVNFRTVFHGLNREGKHELAHSVLQSKWHLWRQRRFSD